MVDIFLFYLLKDFFGFYIVKLHPSFLECRALPLESGLVFEWMHSCHFQTHNLWLQIHVTVGKVSAFQTAADLTPVQVIAYA